MRCWRCRWCHGSLEGPHKTLWTMDHYTTVAATHNVHCARDLIGNSCGMGWKRQSSNVSGPLWGSTMIILTCYNKFQFITCQQHQNYIDNLYKYMLNFKLVVHRYNWTLESSWYSNQNLELLTEIFCTISVIICQYNEWSNMRGCHVIHVLNMTSL